MPTPPIPGVPRLPEMVGATSAPIELGKATAHIGFAIGAPSGPTRLLGDALLRRVFLNIENITSDAMAPSYNVYLNVPQGDDPQKHPDLRVGNLALFGLVESSRSDEEHPGNGLSFKMEVTAVYLRLVATSDWDTKNVRVSFVPRPWDDEVNVRVGRISLYFE